MLYALASGCSFTVIAWRLFGALRAPLSPAAPAITPILSSWMVLCLAMGQWVVLLVPSCRMRRWLGLPITLVGMALGLATLGHLGPAAQSIAGTVRRLPEAAGGGMLQWTGWATLGMGLTLLPLMSPKTGGRWRRQVSAIVACGTAGISLVAILEALASFSLLYSLSDAFIAVGTGVAFLALSTGAVISAGRDTWPLALVYPAPQEGSLPRFRGYLGAFLLSGMVLFLLGSLALRRWTVGVQRQAQGELAALAEAKTRVIASWLAERDQETQRIFQGPLCRTLLGGYLAAAPGAPDRGNVGAWLDTLQIGAYQRVLLVDAQGRSRIAAPAGADLGLSPVERQGLRTALTTQTIQFLDLHPGADRLDLRMNWWIPVFAPRPGDGCLGALLVQVDAAKWLFPLLESSPLARSSAETLLVRREGTDVVFLSGLRKQQGRLMRLPLAGHPDMPGALAVQGREGFVQGPDYQGAKVMAALARVPGSSWILVAKMDESEFYAPLHLAAWVSGCLVLVVLAVMATVFGFLIRHRLARQMKVLLEVEREKRALGDHYARLMDQASDSIMVVGLDGRIQEVNQAASQMYGLPEQAMIGRHIQEFRAPESEAAFANQFAQVNAGEVVRFECVHLDSRGARIPVEVSSRKVQLGVQPAILSFIRNISERKRHEAELRRVMRLYEALSQVNQAIVMSTDRTALLETICRVMVERGRVTMAWIAWNDPSTHQVAALAHYGDSSGYLEGLRARSDDTPEGRGPLGEALRTGATQILNRFPDGPPSQPWLARAGKAGFKSAGAFPIRPKGQVVGAISVHSAEEDFFGAQEVALLEEAAGDVSFALDHLASEDQRRRMESALRTSEEKFFKTFRFAPMLGSLSEAGDGRFLEVNELYCKALGFDPEELVGQTSLDLGILQPGTRDQIMAAVRSLGRVQNMEISLTRKDGQTIPVFFSGEILEMSGRSVLLSMIADITLLKQSERERRALQNEVEHLQKMDSLGRLAGGIAHDMNNVLAAVLAVTQTAQARHVKNPELDGDLAIVERAAVRGRDLLKGIMDFSRKELAGQVAIDLNQLARQEVALLERTLLKKYRLVIDLHEPLPPTRGERGLLGSALMNLCINAVDAMPEGGTLSIRTQPLPDGFVELSVEDTGVGMSPEVRAHAMDPFFTTKPLGKGTGLGLSMVFNTARTHGGTLTLRSQEGVGTQVLLRLPGFPAPLDIPDASADPASGSRPMSILLVDDDELLRSAVPAMLEHLGHAVEAVDSGRAALARLGQGFNPDCMILDMNMPDMNGLETLRHLRSAGHSLPVLIASGFLGPQETEAIKGDHNVIAIAKPFSMEEIKEKLMIISAMIKSHRKLPTII